MADDVTLGQLRAWVEGFQVLVAAHRGYLTDLDAAIGDADHGTNLDRGLTAVVTALRESPPGAVDELAKTVAMTLISTVGGASGPLYGTFFLRFATAAGPVTTLDVEALALALRAGVDGVVARGHAEPEDKTMVDALSPAITAFETAAADGAASACRAAVAAAEAGRDATTPLVARKGRASYLGERSAGHLDPGAASSALLVRALADAVAGA